MKRAPSDSRSTLLHSLKGLYPEARSELNFSNPYELIIAVVLSAQCTDKKVNEVTSALFAKYPDFTSLCEAPLSELEGIIRPINFFRTKSRNIRELADRIVRDYGGNIPPDHAVLTSLPGVGNKTANVVLGELGVKHTLPVDTHVFRLAHRLGFAKGKTPTDVERELCAQFAPETWRALHHGLILHGRRICKAQRPLCHQCALLAICPTGQRVKGPDSAPRRRAPKRKGSEGDLPRSTRSSKRPPR